MNKTITVLCLNCYGAPISFNRKLRFGLIAKEIASAKPDIVMLQEAFYSSDTSLLLSHLGTKRWHFYPSNFPSFNKGGLILITRHGMNLEQSGFVKFKDQGPLKFLSLADRIAGKGFQYGQIMYNDKRILIVNAHMVCMYNEKYYYKNAYKNQLTQLHDFLNKWKDKPFILGGDLNDGPESPDIIRLKNEFNLSEVSKELFTVSYLNTNRAGWLKPFLRQQLYRTDYVFTSKPLRLLSEEVVFDKPYKIKGKLVHISDHYGIIAKIMV